MKVVAVVLAMIGLVCGVCSAVFWFKSSKVRFVVRAAHMVTATGPGVTLGDVEPYLQEVGRLNARAAIFAALAVLASTASTVVSSLSVC